MLTRYSIISRFLAFLAVSCSIVAVSWTSREPTLLVIGIPGLAAGHFYSWRRRDRVSRRRTLILLLFMILTAYIGGEIVLSGMSDRLLLSRYLIYGLVLGSFDLLKRRNVNASLILGGLLLVLISEFALDVRFLAFLIAFTALALSAAVFGRVEVEASQAMLVGGSGWLTIGKVWMSFVIGTLALSTFFFLVMPRLASNQVAQASWLPSRLDLSLGGLAMLPSRPSASVSPGILPSLQDGRAGGKEYATLGYVGSSADRAVMQVRSLVSSYWRGLTLNEYDGRGWLSSLPQITLYDESRQEFVFPDSRLILSGEKVYGQAYYMLSDQPNAVFTGYNPGRVYLPKTGQTFLEKGTLYRAFSAVPYLRPELLRSDTVVTQDVLNLKLPPISERVAALAESIVQGAATDYDKAARLERFLLTNYAYDLNVGSLPAGREAVDFFLFEQQAGYCSQFATAMAVMARHIGLPARIAAGYLPGFIDPMTGAHMVRVGDAHAWVEIHFRRYGWVAFDPTPRPNAPLGFAARRNWVYFGLEEFTGVTFASILSPLAGNLALGPPSMPGWVWVVLPGGGVTIAGLALFLSRRKRKTGQVVRGYSILDGEARRAMLNFYQKMIAVLTKKGLPSRRPHQPPYEYASLVCSRIPNAREAVEQLTQAACSAAYDPKLFNPSTVRAAKQWLSDLKRALARRN